jgi:hypothetical protein
MVDRLASACELLIAIAIVTMLRLVRAEMMCLLLRIGFSRVIALCGVVWNAKQGSRRLTRRSDLVL